MLPTNTITRIATMASVPPTAVPAWVAICSNLAPLASMVVISSPLPTIRDVERKQNVGSLPLLPYSSMIASSFLWTAYGLLKKEPKVWMTNFVGLGVGMYYFRKFAKFAPAKAPTFPGSIRQHIQACAFTVAATLGVIFAAPVKEPSAIVGNLAVLLCLLLFGSPLAALKSVFASKSAKSIPLPFTLATVLNCFLWSVSGLLDLKDPKVYFPNLVGLTFGLSQVALKLVFGDGSKARADVEMESMM